jgi:hypothetical protein
MGPVRAAGSCKRRFGVKRQNLDTYLVLQELSAQVGLAQSCICGRRQGHALRGVSGRTRRFAVRFPGTASHSSQGIGSPRCRMFFLWHQKSPSRVAAGQKSWAQSWAFFGWKPSGEGQESLGDDVSGFMIGQLTVPGTARVRPGASRGAECFWKVGRVPNKGPRELGYGISSCPN